MNIINVLTLNTLRSREEYMPKKKKQEGTDTNSATALPKGWRIRKREGDWAIVEIPENDLTRVRLLKLPEGVRDYFKQRQRDYRKRLKEKKKEIS